MHNRLQCLQCEDVIESLHRHDFVWCSCQSMFVDGGREYIRFGGRGLSTKQYKLLTEYED